MGQRNIPIAKIVSISLFVISFAFSASMIGTNTNYLQGRIDLCYDAGYTNCPDRIHDYLFKDYRNTTFKAFTDCFMAAVDIITFILFTFLLHKIPRWVQFVLLFILLGLSLMSLASGYRSIDQEDEENEPTIQESLPKVLAGIAAGEKKLADSNTNLVAMKQKLASVQAQKAAAPCNGVCTNYDTAITTLITTISSLEGAYTLRDGIYNMLDQYDHYRTSVMALVLVNFVAIYSLCFLYGFMYSHLVPTSNPVKLEQQSGVLLEAIQLKNKTSSNETEAINLA